MTMGRLLRAVLRIVALLAVVLLTVGATQFIWAYFIVPRVVAHFERTTPLPIDPKVIGQTRREWLLRVDDPNFYRHHGIDSRTPGAGFTTITQGLVKILFFDDFQPGMFRWRKVKQTIVALAFNARVSKDEQLMLFVNAVYLGNREGHDVKGFSAASVEYFGKPFAQLSDDEFLQLVAMIVAPDKFNLATHPDQNRERVQRIKRLLAGECAPSTARDVEYVGCAL
jgi:membrane carboxypeptidase/penicillin-binding protein